jgi:predicted ATP-grasp superfamily ATP-dependent carboligase
MHVFLYEWITGGGLVNEAGRLPASLLVEGSAMVTALAADFAAINGATVTVLRDARLFDLALPDCEIIEIHSAVDRQQELQRLAAAADWTLIVAPEFDGILRSTVTAARNANGRLLNATDDFIALASDKHRTAERLRASGVPAPAGQILEADEEKLPLDFAYPGVLKPRDGAGSQHTLLVSGPGDEPAPYPWQRRLERFCPGRAASVGVLCGDAGMFPLPPCWQHLSADERFTYRGGSTIQEGHLAQRARSLALHALTALPPAHGYVGVDIVLGAAPNGGEDSVIEVNPRVTTSYVGLRAIVEQNLAESMLQVARGEGPTISASDRAVEFSASGVLRPQLW